jgi:hypothetical protein
MKRNLARARLRSHLRPVMREFGQHSRILSMKQKSNLMKRRADVIRYRQSASSSHHGQSTKFVLLIRANLSPRFERHIASSSTKSGTKWASAKAYHFKSHIHAKPHRFKSIKGWHKVGKGRWTTK